MTPEQLRFVRANIRIHDQGQTGASVGYSMATCIEVLRLIEVAEGKRVRFDYVGLGDCLRRGYERGKRGDIV